MLNILKKQELTNVLVIVTRYFGGVLLGTGGLVKAYSDVTIQSIENSKVIEKELGYIAEVVVEYQKQKEFEYICDKNQIKIISKEFTDKITNTIEISEAKYLEIFQKNSKNNSYKLLINVKNHKYITKTSWNSKIY